MHTMFATLYVSDACQIFIERGFVPTPLFVISTTSARVRAQVLKKNRKNIHKTPQPNSFCVSSRWNECERHWPSGESEKDTRNFDWSENLKVVCFTYGVRYARSPTTLTKKGVNQIEKQNKIILKISMNPIRSAQRRWARNVSYSVPTSNVESGQHNLTTTNAMFNHIPVRI